KDETSIFRRAPKDGCRHAGLARLRRRYAAPIIAASNDVGAPGDDHGATLHPLSLDAGVALALFSPCSAGTPASPPRAPPPPGPRRSAPRAPPPPPPPRPPPPFFPAHRLPPARRRFRRPRRPNRGVLRCESPARPLRR